jgi:hypothetical protein
MKYNFEKHFLFLKKADPILSDDDDKSVGSSDSDETAANRSGEMTTGTPPPNAALPTVIPTTSPPPEEETEDSTSTSPTTILIETTTTTPPQTSTTSPGGTHHHLEFIPFGVEDAISSSSSSPGGNDTKTSTLTRYEIYPGKSVPEPDHSPSNPSLLLLPLKLQEDSSSLVPILVEDTPLRSVNSIDLPAGQSSIYSHGFFSPQNPKQPQKPQNPYEDDDEEQELFIQQAELHPFPPPPQTTTTTTTPTPPKTTPGQPITTTITTTTLHSKIMEGSPSRTWSKFGIQDSSHFPYALGGSSSSAGFIPIAQPPSSTWRPSGASESGGSGGGTPMVSIGMSSVSSDHTPKKAGKIVMSKPLLRRKQTQQMGGGGLEFKPVSLTVGGGGSGFGGGASSGSGLLGGGLKLSGCNIYGRMYRVGETIRELSSLCVLCRCSEFGVACSELQC